MLEKITERRATLNEQRENLLGQYEKLKNPLRDYEQKINMFAGHIGELDFQIAELSKADEVSAEESASD